MLEAQPVSDVVVGRERSCCCEDTRADDAELDLLDEVHDPPIVHVRVVEQPHLRRAVLLQTILSYVLS